MREKVLYGVIAMSERVRVLYGVIAMSEKVLYGVIAMSERVRVLYVWSSTRTVNDLKFKVRVKAKVIKSQSQPSQSESRSHSQSSVIIIKVTCSDRPCISYCTAPVVASQLRIIPSPYTANTLSASACWERQSQSQGQGQGEDEGQGKGQHRGGCEKDRMDESEWW